MAVVDDAHEPVGLRLVATVALYTLRHIVINTSSSSHDVTGLFESKRSFWACLECRDVLRIVGQLLQVVLAWRTAHQAVARCHQLQTSAVMAEAGLHDSQQELLGRFWVDSFGSCVRVLLLNSADVTPTVLAETTHVAHRAGLGRSAVTHHARHVFIHPHAVQSIQRLVCCDVRLQ